MLLNPFYIDLYCSSKISTHLIFLLTSAFFIATQIYVQWNCLTKSKFRHIKKIANRITMIPLIFLALHFPFILIYLLHHELWNHLFGALEMKIKRILYESKTHLDEFKSKIFMKSFIPPIHKRCWIELRNWLNSFQSPMSTSNKFWHWNHLFQGQKTVNNFWISTFYWFLF